MTLKSFIKVVKALSLNHKQIKNFFYNVEASEWLNDKKTKYPAAFLLDQQGNISTGGNATTLAFTMFFVDMVNAADYTKQNELDVQSDMLSVAQDIIAQLNYPGITGYYLGTDAPVKFIIVGTTESDNDMLSGVQIDFSVRFPFPQDVCAVPSIADFINDFNNDFN